MNRRFAMIGGVIFSLQRATSALAQDGSLTYGPVAASISAPLGGLLWLFLLGGLLSALGIWKLRHERLRRSCATLVLLVAIGVLASRVVGPPFTAVFAGLATTELDNPNGGTVFVPKGSQSYLNTSGVQLRITGLIPPCDGPANSAIDPCQPGVTLLAAGESCQTEFSCGEPEVCDGVDNDLNGLIDDSVTPPDEPCGETWQCTGVTGWLCGPCVPSCSGKACGSDGCDGSCGTCSGGFVCDDSGMCIPDET